MAELYKKLAEKNPKWIIIESGHLVKDDDGKIKLFNSEDEVNYYIDVQLDDDGIVYECYKYYGRFD